MTHPLGVHVKDARDLYGMSRKRSASAGSLLKYFSMGSTGQSTHSRTFPLTMTE